MILGNFDHSDVRGSRRNRNNSDSRGRVVRIIGVVAIIWIRG